MWGCGASAPAEENAIQFRARAFERAVPGCGDLEKAPHPCVAYRVSWPEAAGGAPGEARERINAALREALRPAPPAAGWEEEAALLEAAYREFQERKFDNEAAFYIRRIAEVVRNSNEILSFSLTEDRYLGGDAPEFRQTYLNFAPRTGARLRLGELLAPGAEEELRRYAAAPGEAAFAPAPEGLYLSADPAAPPALIPWARAAGWFPARSGIAPRAAR
mgnify:FL=1